MHPQLSGNGLQSSWAVQNRSQISRGISKSEVIRQYTRMLVARTCTSSPDGVCNLVRYGNYYGTHSVTNPCNCFVSFDMCEIRCVTRSVTRMCSLRGQNVRFFCVTVSVTFTVTTTHMQHTAAPGCVFVVGARRANT